MILVNDIQFEANFYVWMEQVTKHPVASKDDDDAFISSEPDPPSFHWQVVIN